VDSSRLQAELLLAHVLKLPRMKLYLNFERTLVPAEADSLRELVKRRGQREPLQHIVGSTSFCGFEITVNRHVLVPRPETEMLAELGWEFLLERGRVGCPQPAKNGTRRGTDTAPYQPGVLDFGTGSGCLAIAIGAKCPQARVTALDVSAEALAVARLNLARHGLAERVQLIEGDGFAALTDARFDLIVSNPPYIPTAEIESLQPEVRDFDPRTALDGGADGLDFIRRLAIEAGALLAPLGKLMFEFGDAQADAAREIFSGQNWIVEALRDDYSQRPRFLIARRD
jgi:release factor glutamine methyltransferase